MKFINTQTATDFVCSECSFSVNRVFTIMYFRIEKMSVSSFEIDLKDFAQYSQRLDELAKPRKTEVRHCLYAQYVNCFISKFVKERAYVVGSTAEQSKLPVSKDCDVDVLIVSGTLNVSADNLEYKIHNPCYVWIKADETSKNMDLELVDSKYLSANMLRELRPELFTLLRAVHLQATACINRLPDAGKSTTIVSVPSKVGLASTCYSDLKLYGNDVPISYQYSRKDALKRSEQTKQHLIKRWKTVTVHEHDKKMLERIFKVIKAGKHPGGRGQPNGQYSFVVQAADDALRREKLTGKETLPDIGQKRRNSPDIDSGDSPKNILYDNDLNDDNGLTTKIAEIRATYRSKSNRDFVPALKVVGDIKYMQQWKSRVKTAGWPEPKINDIYTTDIFVVSRVATVNPNMDKDFCLSFNLAEQKLVKMMTCVQRRVYLILKAYLKGTFEEIHMKEGLEIKLKTYHVKTLLFWLYESCQSSADEDNPKAVYSLLQTALDYLRNKLVMRELFHYFIPNNLFIDFEDVDFRLLIECVDLVRYNPVAGMKKFFDLDDGMPQEKCLTPEELETFLELLNDGGRRRFVDRIEDAIVDIFRGLNECKRDEEGRAPIKEAVIDTLRLFFKDERHIDMQIFKQVNTLLRYGLNEGDYPGVAEVTKRVKDVFLLIDGLGVFMPQIKDFMAVFGGRPGLQSMLEGALKGTPLDFSEDIGEQIIETMDRYLSCPDEDEDGIASELKYKFLGYFSGLKEFPHLSSHWV